MIARRLDITESTVKVHVKHMLKKMKLKSRVEAAVWVHQSESSKASPSRDAWRGKLDQRLGQRQGDLIGGDALPLFILHHHRQAPAVRGARFTVPHRHNDAPAIGAAGIYRRRQAEGTGVSLPVQRLDTMQTMDLQLQLHRLPGLQIPWRRGQIDRQIFALTILHHRQIIPLRTIEAAPAQRVADRHLVCRKLLLKGYAKAVV